MCGESSKRSVCNMQVLKRSKHEPQVGDVFCISIIPGSLHFGRVIRTDARAFVEPSSNLLYFYKATSSAPEVLPTLRRDDLLIPPIMTNDQGWLQGYFQHIENRPLIAGDVLPVHCFYSLTHKKYFNEHWEELREKSEPCGTFGLFSYSGIDKELSKALGIPLIEDPGTDSIDDSAGFVTLPRDTLNDNMVTLSIRVPHAASSVDPELSRDEIEDALESEFAKGSLAKWYASGSYESYAHIDYDVAPGKYPQVYDAIEQVMADLGIQHYRILVQEDRTEDERVEQ